MRGHYPGAVLVTIDNRALGDRQASPFHVRTRNVDQHMGGWGHAHLIIPHPHAQAHTKAEDRWARASSFHVAKEGLAAFNKAIAGGRSSKAGPELEACRSLVDVDEHLDDAGKDFRNPQIAAWLASASS